MGACQSRQLVAVPNDVRGSNGGKAEDLKVPAENENTDQAPSDPTHDTCLTSHDSSECCAETTSANEASPSSAKSFPILEESKIRIDSEADRQDAGVSLHSISPEDLSNSEGSTHVKKTSDMLLDYFRGDGASENRTMVYIENPLGVSIEDVYDGVHDGKVLGVGVTGEVRLITHKETGIQRALKRLDLGHLKNSHDLDVLLDEVKIMCALDHPNIICLEEVYEGDSELYLTQELCTGGDLFDRLERQSNFCYNEAQCAKLVQQIISAVSYLHSKNIIHRDLKLENFLFQDESNDSELKMIDFGLSKHFHVGELQHERVGTPYTVSPEVIISKEGYDEKVDVWAIGVITYLLLSGETPFGGACGEDLVEVRNKILACQLSFDDSVWDRVSDLAIDFIKSVLVLDPHKRPSVDDLRKHPWLILMKRSSSLSDDEVSLDPKVVSGLVSFKDMSNTTKFLCEVLSFTLQPGQISGLREEFEKMDSSGMGEINLAGFKTALLSRSDEFPLSEVQVEDIFNGLKLRKRDISIRWHEFIAACLSQCQVDERNIRLAFDRLDSQHKGYVTLNDLKSIMDFYGTDRADLQKFWLNDVIDYKSEKEHMTYDDFYRLLKLDRHFNGPNQIARNTIPSRCDDSHNIIRRHSELDLEKIPVVVSNVKAYRAMHSTILDASRFVCDAHPEIRDARRKRPGLLLCRSAQEAHLSLACKSLESTMR
ncbi:hypothetical protein HJC23_002434 [Cyclotella cryptica]|uniref:Calmodulin n=1 Tax=Cyclotella cryptica TaxID=29204 RepID=A0ABD3PUU9_9STRA|eukprot:CCRYP_011145-RA/>CCRYP_011145-RA protein AED:0.31 eAED:0.31 QI:250/1/1/1/1/1/3/1359/710